jgi:hypothetical protein
MQTHVPFSTEIRNLNMQTDKMMLIISSHDRFRHLGRTPNYKELLEKMFLPLKETVKYRRVHLYGSISVNSKCENRPDGHAASYVDMRFTHNVHGVAA